MTHKFEEISLSRIKKLVEDKFVGEVLNKSTAKKLASDLVTEMQRQWTENTDNDVDDITDYFDFDSVVAFENKQVRVLNWLDPNRMQGTKDLVILLPKYVATKPNSLKQLRKYVESKITINWARVTFMSVDWTIRQRKTFTCSLIRYLMNKIDVLFWLDPETVAEKYELSLSSWHRITSVPSRISIEVPLVKNDGNSRVFRSGVSYSQEVGENGAPNVGTSLEYTTEYKVGDYDQQAGRIKRK